MLYVPCELRFRFGFRSVGNAENNVSSSRCDSSEAMMMLSEIIDIIKYVGCAQLCTATCNRKLAGPPSLLCLLHLLLASERKLRFGGGLGKR